MTNLHSSALCPRPWSWDLGTFLRRWVNGDPVHAEMGLVRWVFSAARRAVGRSDALRGRVAFERCRV